ncbi:VCBS repeat-containing protein [Dyadobacter sp. CY343]|uniref:FG-GAP repeat domain-containing protein n=1 Tax=Dyadobacter sp. CY343 TaxID=2907299 RepID=UPI001F46BD7A|nr:VCBS repeat-containing protein [Dyadobacter sp. CY343]MCE7058950.1 VCBS repeat-containing protein [Dyadobacter sp. CY343]
MTLFTLNTGCYRSAGNLKIALGCLIMVISLISCGPSKDETLLTEGQQLATKYCGNCHLTPGPELLDKVTWRENVLPAMAERLGVEVLEGNMYLHSQQSTISSPDWQKLLKYYETLAPDSLTKPGQTAPNALQNELFKLLKPAEDSAIASTMVVKFDTLVKELLVGPASEPALYSYNQKLDKTFLEKLISPPVNISFSAEKSGKYIITAMGGMRALDETRGQISLISKDKQAGIVQISRELIRPIETTPVDFNQDNLTDYLVCAFGHNLGGLYLLKQLPDHTFQKVVVKEVPGATHTTIRDFNNDGWPDIMALFAHGDEGIWVFLNNKKGGFEERNILRFPPVYGSSSFQLMDMNADGKEDILYTAGDNSDYSRILKPYHGVYVFTNTGNLTFKQTFFYPINGCTKAVAADFDQDGKVEMATIAFFADLKNKPYEKFLYFKSDPLKPLNFAPFIALPDKMGRWICMDAGDWDGDGDMDIALGNFSRGFLNQERIQPDWNVKMPFVILQNNTISKSK